MFKTLSNSWVLAKECWEILMHDKEMLVYPILTTAVNICILGMAFLYFLGIGYHESEYLFDYTNAQWAAGIALVVATMYACYFTYSFFECALVASAIKRLRGENPTLMYGLKVAADRIPQLAGWSVYMTIFGILVALIQSLFKSRWARRTVGTVAETAWNVVTVFVLPLIIVENAGSFEAVKKSVALVKKKWGEAATLEIGFGTLCSIAAVPIAGVFILAQQTEQISPMLSIIFLTIGFVLCAALGLVFAALNGIVKAVLYNFAMGGTMPDEIHRETLDGLVGRGGNDTTSARPFQT